MWRAWHPCPKLRILQRKNCGFEAGFGWFWRTNLQPVERRKLCFEMFGSSLVTVGSTHVVWSRPQSIDQSITFQRQLPVPLQVPSRQHREMRCNLTKHTAIYEFKKYTNTWVDTLWHITPKIGEFIEVPRRYFIFQALSERRWQNAFVHIRELQPQRNHY